jgi:DHA1 family bicyclomycin/chloramphenicol resistance-like MFS transporter
MAEALDQILIARAIQGLGAAGPRIVSIALVRDLFSGRQMARITSFIMTVFTLVPVVAPSLGAALEWAFGWRAIFLSFAVFSIVSTGWLLLRQAETLPHERRRPFRLGNLAEGLREVFSNRQIVISICVQTLIFGMLFAALFSSQAIFDVTLGKKGSFPFWFGVMAALSASSSILNAMFVVRFGMKNMVKWGLLIQAVLTALFLFAQMTVWSDVPPVAGIAIGNMNAIALEPMGHIAGMASSVISAVFTVASVFIAAPIGQMFDGTMVPLSVGVLVLGCAAFGLVLLREDTGGEIAESSS